ncbi:MAG: YhcH/YjgK/YiaL family protein [Lentisphaeria bacterium]|nr:YhcH/YjgK/YiaL family protein [Lentisphaeria bacterium]
MIFDKIENLKLYAGSFPGADKVIEFLAECAKKTPEPGKYELDGKKLFVGVQEYSPKTFNSDKLEYHRDYIDIQLLFSGAEDLYYAPLDGLDTVMPYTPEKDCGLSRIPAPEAGTKFSLKPGNFVLLCPEEGHLPGVGDPAGHVIKAVVKIAVK